MQINANRSKEYSVGSRQSHRLQTEVPLADKRTAPRNDRVARDGTIACRRLQLLRGGDRHDQRTRLKCGALRVDLVLIKKLAAAWLHYPTC